MFKKLSLIALFYSGILFGANTTAEKKVFHRCYSQLTKKRPVTNHRLIHEIDKKKMNGPEACFQLIDNINIESSSGRVSPMDEDSMTIFQTFQKIHNSWFPLYDLNIGTQDHPNTDIYDTNEMGYHFTWALFKEGEKLDSVLTKKRSFLSQRKSDRPHLFFIDRDIGGRRLQRKGKEDHKWKVGGSTDENDPGYQGPVYFWEPELVKFGKLIGLQPYTQSKNKINIWISKNETQTLDIHSPLGGGIIGTIPYLLLNTGQNNLKSDGGNILHRRWSTNIMKDLLCRKIPTLSESYVNRFLRKDSTLVFRQKKDCMNCHMTIDQMAGVIRNVENFNSGDVDTHYTIRNILPYRTHNWHKGVFPDQMESFYRTNPEGYFVHQDLDGNTINVKINNIEELGKVLSENVDFYRCITKRYFEFFTGIKFDLEQENWNKPTPEGAFIKDQASKLSKHKKIKRLIKEIFFSGFYRHE